MAATQFLRGSTRPNTSLVSSSGGRFNNVPTPPSSALRATQPRGSSLGMLIGVVALLAGCLGSAVGVVAALRWGPSGTATTTMAFTENSTVSVEGPSRDVKQLEHSSQSGVGATPVTDSAPTYLIDELETANAPESSEALAFAEAVDGDDQAQWMLQLNPNRPETEGLTIKGSGAETNYPLFMVRDYQNAPIAWIAPHGGLSVTDNIRVKSGVFQDDGVSMRRWTDNIALTGPGGFSWDGAELVQTTVGGSGSAEPLPGDPELWLRIMDNTGDEPRYLVIPAYLDQ